MKTLYVETNFLIEHARAEHSAAEVLLSAAERGVFKLVVPAFCLYEALEKQRRERPEREQRAKALQDEAHNLERKGLDPSLAANLTVSAQGLRQLNDVWAAGLDTTLDRLLRTARVLPLSAELVGDARMLSARLARGDPWHVAATLADWRAQGQPAESLCLTGDAQVRGYLVDQKLEAVATSAEVARRWNLDVPPTPSS